MLYEHLCIQTENKIYNKRGAQHNSHHVISSLLHFGLNCWEEIY